MAHSPLTSRSPRRGGLSLPPVDAAPSPRARRLPTIALDPMSHVYESLPSPPTARSPYVPRGALPAYDAELHGVTLCPSPHGATLMISAYYASTQRGGKRKLQPIAPGVSVTPTRRNSQRHSRSTSAGSRHANEQLPAVAGAGAAQPPISPSSADEPASSASPPHPARGSSRSPMSHDAQPSGRLSHNTSSVTLLPEPPMQLSELTATYVRVLQRSEDYARRALERTRNEALSIITQPYDKLQEFVQRCFAHRRQFAQQEEELRLEVDYEERRDRAVIQRHFDVSYQGAKRHEEIQPQCPVLAPGKRVHLDPEMLAGLIVEMRWRGSVEVVLQAFIFDDSGALMQVASRTNLVKGAEARVAVRHIGASFAGAAGLGIGGSRDCMLAVLANLPPRARSVVFVAFGGAHGNVPLSNAKRCWLTVVAPGKPPHEVYTSMLGDGSSITAITLCALEKRTAGVWQLHAINSAFVAAASPARNAEIVSRQLAQPLVAVEQDEVPVAWERLVQSAISTIEETFRKYLITWETEARKKTVADCSREATLMSSASSRFLSRKGNAARPASNS